MRFVSLLAGILLTASSLQGNGYWEKNKFIQDCDGGGYADLTPVLRVFAVPRFFEDTSALSILGEYGREHNRVNATLGFPFFCEHIGFKFGGEMLNQRLGFRFPHDSENVWVRQYAAGGGFHFGLEVWGLKSFEIEGQWSNAQGHELHHFKHHKKLLDENFANRPPHSFHRSVSGSNAYVISAGVTLAPWFWSTLSAAVVYDNIKYTKKHVKNEVVKGWGGTVFFEQRFTPSISGAFIGEFVTAFNYYEGNLRWRKNLASTDVIIGAFGGHTEGKKGLPSSTIAGIEIGFDFGLTDYSMCRSIGICGNSPDNYCQSSLGGLRREYLEWMAMPAVYVPQVLSISEQHVLIHKH